MRGGSSPNGPARGGNRGHSPRPRRQRVRAALSGVQRTFTAAWASLRADRRRSLGTLGLLAFLLSQVFFAGFVARGIDALYVQNSPSLIGRNDLILVKDTTRGYPALHFPATVETQITAQVPEIVALGRLYTIAKITRDADLGTAGTPPYESLVVGINYAREQAVQRALQAGVIPNSIGGLQVLDAQFQPVATPLPATLPNGSCLLTRGLAEALNVTAGDELFVEFVTTNQFLTVQAVVENQGRFPEVNPELLVTNLAWTQRVLHLENRLNAIFGVFRHPEAVYDLRDADASFENIETITERLLAITGPGFTAKYPRLLTLQLSSTEIYFLSTILYCIQVLPWAMFVLFYYKRERLWALDQVGHFRARSSPAAGGAPATTSIASTATKAPVQPAKLARAPARGVVTARGILLVTTALGIGLGGAVLSSLVARVPTPGSMMVQDLGMGLVLGTLTVVVTAVRCHPRDSTKGEARERVPWMILGAILAGTGGFLLNLLPDLLITFNFTLFTFYSFFLIMSVVAGCALALAPLVSALVRWTRRRSGTSRRFQERGLRSLAVVFVVAFALVFLVATLQQVRSQNLTNQIVFESGGDVVLTNAGTSDDENYLNVSVVMDLRANPRVRAVAPVLSNVPPLESTLSRVIEMSLGTSELSTGTVDFAATFRGDFEGSSEAVPFPKRVTEVSDPGFMETIGCSLFGVDESFLDVVAPELILWNEDAHGPTPESGNLTDPCSLLFTTSNSCILSTAIARDFGIQELGATVVLRVQTTTEAAGEIPREYVWNYIPLRVVGIADGIPGFTNFYDRLPEKKRLPGILVAIPDYLTIQGQPELGNPSQVLPVDRVLVALRDPSAAREITRFRDDVFADLSEEYAFRLSDPASKLNYIRESNAALGPLLEYLFASLLLCVTLAWGVAYRRETTRVPGRSGGGTWRLRLVLPGIILGVSILLGFLVTLVLFSLAALITSLPATLGFQWIPLVIKGLSTCGFVFGATWLATREKSG